MPPFEGTSLVAPNCEYGGKFEKITAVDRYTVEFDLCAPFPAFLETLAFSVFSIYPAEWIEATIGDGVRTTEALDAPVGTGPYMVKEWARGESITFERNPNFWGTPGLAETLVFRWNSEGAARLLELQSGTVDGIDNPSPDDFEVITADSSLQLIERPALNIFYVGITNTYPPFDNIQVRQAVAMGIDRQRIVDNFYPAGSEVASHFTPCVIPNGCAGDAWYDFDVEAAKALLTEAGFPDGFDTTIYYRDVFRGYLPEPGRVAEELQAQLKANLNIDAKIECGIRRLHRQRGRRKLDASLRLGADCRMPALIILRRRVGQQFKECPDIVEYREGAGRPTRSRAFMHRSQQRDPSTSRWSISRGLARPSRDVDPGPQLAALGEVFAVFPRKPRPARLDPER
jgi:ABC-type oligopeptide transport system substrate-binding subunit